MNKDNSVSRTSPNDSTGLKVYVNFKTGAIASNPSLLYPAQVIIRDLKISDNLKGGARPCATIIFSNED